MWQLKEQSNQSLHYFLLLHKTRLHAFNSHVSTGTNHCINKAILMLLMQRLGRDFFLYSQGWKSAPVQMVFWWFFPQIFVFFWRLGFSFSQHTHKSTVSDIICDPDTRFILDNVNSYSASKKCLLLQIFADSIDLWMCGGKRVEPDQELIQALF